MPSNDQKAHWEKTYSGKSSFFGNESSAFGRTAVEVFKREGVRTVLELGCGQGRDTLLFAGEGFDVTALDYSEAGLLGLQGSAEEAGVSDRVVTKRTDVRKPLAFPDGSFDACYSHMLICMELSTAELEVLFGEIRRVLKVGGVVLYSVRNNLDKQYRTGIHKSEDMYEIGGGFVVHFFSQKKVLELAGGCEVLEIRRMQEGDLPKELFGVGLRNQGSATGGSGIRRS